MKKYYLSLFLLCSFFIEAQVLTIPDANFKAKLLEADTNNTIAKNSLYQSIKIDSNNNNEIEISEALNVCVLNLSYNSIQSLSGIQNFTNLKDLSCSGNQLTNLDLSNNINLLKIDCSFNQLSNLNIANLSNLTDLTCNYNQLTSLDLSNNLNLIYLKCIANQLTSLNVTNLTNLTDLSCNNNQLTSLNVTNLTNLTDLSCNNNQLTNLNLSTNTNLLHVYCQNNLLQNLNLVNTLLQELNCSYNQLTNLDFYGISIVQELNCSYNQLVTLNFIGISNIVSLNCSNNQLVNLNLNAITSISIFNCSNNLLVNLDFSNTIVNMPFYSNNPFLTTLNLKNGYNDNFNATLTNLAYICADEFEVSQFIQILQNNLSLNCQVNSYCTFSPGGQFYTIQGQQKFDDENNGCDSTDGVIPSIKYTISNGTVTGSIISNNSGNYSIPVQSGTHTITPILENPSYFNVSPTNVVVNFPTQASPFSQDFCIAPNGTHHDVEVLIIPITPARPGFDAYYKIIYKNKGNQVENGTIQLQYDDAVLDVVSINPAFSSQTTNILNWTYSNLYPLESREITVIFNVNSPLETPSVNAGDFLIYSAQITQQGTDENFGDNSFGLKQVVVNSYDPNDKTCLQGNEVGTDKIGEYVYYTIRFENTGTYPAENIVVKDLIDTSKFDVSSLVPLYASHNYFTRISENKVEFIFENINLPFDDANNDGFVTFKIKTLPSLVVGSTFSNTANIYFDYNFPIITNTYTTTIAALNNPSFELANYFILYPNPVNEELNIALKSPLEINSIEIYNTIGQLVQVQTGNALKVDVSHLKTGNYFIKVKTNEGYTTSQFIKE